mmetsp:Transcript_29061/g.52951  ORF Transcript_29061/g.52951 Transcript_29061/m.52951 type:complete len:474 (-) Transcript_29061:113-1534(-)
MRRSIEQLLLLVRGPAQDESQWTVGMRYQMARNAPLFSSIEMDGKEVGKVHCGEVVLVLAVAMQPAEPGSQFQAVTAYLARTNMSHHRWTCGWGEVQGADGQAPALSARHQRGCSWEVGGRYVAACDMHLQAGVELETSDQGILHHGEDALFLSFSLLIMDRQKPHLRAHVRSESGVIGWVSVEAYGAPSNFYPTNLHSDAIFQPRCFCWPYAKICCAMPWQRMALQPRASFVEARRAPASSWEDGGKYWILGNKVWIREQAELQSEKVAQVGLGIPVVVLEKREVERPESPDTVVRLKVETLPKKGPAYVGWVSGQDPNNSLLVDTRNHLEFDCLLLQLEALAKEKSARQHEQLTPLAESSSGAPLQEEERLPPTASAGESEKDEDQLRANADASTDSPDASFQPPSSDQAVNRNHMDSDEDEDEQELFDRRHRTEMEGPEGLGCFGRTVCCTTTASKGDAPYCFRQLPLGS